TAGYDLGDDRYDIGEVFEETLYYEEADLGAPRIPKRQRRIGLVAFSEAIHGAMLPFGSAGRSSLRDRTLTQPGQATALRVDPAPVTVASKDTLTIGAGAATYTSVWRADQTRRARATSEAASLGVVELSELA